MNDSQLVWPLGLFLLLLFTSCDEDFQRTPPFTAVQDTTFLDGTNWFYLNPEPQTADGVAIFPFSYRIFDQRFEGFLLNAAPRTYMVGQDAEISQRTMLLDTRLTPGDTIQKLFDLRYFLLLDRRQDDLTGEEVFYVLRRTLIGMRSRRESSIWVLSPKSGIVAAADYEIDQLTGTVAFLQIVGEPSYFDTQGLLYKIKQYDHHTATYVDRERNLIYKFNKLDGTLISRNFSERKDLYQYNFPPSQTKGLVDFYLELQENQIKLVTGDSCYFFSQQLDLQRSGNCP